jgi:toxin ParE1/3/4
MAYRLSPKANRDVDDIISFIADQNPRAALKLLDRFEARWQLLTTQPRSGAPRDDLGAGFRTVAVGEYLSIYRIEGNSVVILRVLHGRRNIAADDVASEGS